MTPAPSSAAGFLDGIRGKTQAIAKMNGVSPPLCSCLLASALFMFVLLSSPFLVPDTHCLDPHSIPTIPTPDRYPSPGPVPARSS